MQHMDDGTIKMNKEDVYDHIRNRPPLLMIDNAVVKPGEYVVVHKHLHDEDWFFECHFPGEPLMPGVLQLESMFNASALAIKTLPGLKDKTTNISRVTEVAFYDQIHPEDNITIKVFVTKKYRRGIAGFHGEIVNDEETKVLAKADFILSIPEEMIVRK